MSQFLLINDIHLSDRAPRNCTPDYLDDLFTLLYHASKLAMARSCDAIILAGDIFDNKVPSRTSHGTIMRVIDWVDFTPVTVYAVPGNHDLSHDRIQSLRENQPLGVLMAAGKIEWLDGWLTDEYGTFPDDPLVYGVPWLPTFDQPAVDDALRAFCDRTSDHQPALVVAHAPLYPPGRELKYEFFPAADWATAMNHHGTVHYGHVHDPHGVYTVDNVTFSNPGALSRGSLTEHNLHRTPAVAIWDSVTGAISHHELPAKPAEQVFNLDKAAHVKTAQLNLTEFLSGVHATRLEISTTDAVLDHVRTHHDDPALLALIGRLLQDAS